MRTHIHIKQTPYRQLYKNKKQRMNDDGFDKDKNSNNSRSCTGWMGLMYSLYL